MATLGFFRRLWLTRFSRPAGERVIYRHLLRTPARRILELGIGLLVRTERVLQTAAAGQQGPIQYVGLDRFEGRAPTDPPGVSLKQAHQRLHTLGKVQLVPGTVDTSLSRLCNHLGSFDLVLVAAENDERLLERSWFFLQRLITPQTTVFVESKAVGGSSWQLMSKPRIDELAAKSVLKKAG